MTGIAPDRILFAKDRQMTNRITVAVLVASAAAAITLAAAPGRAASFDVPTADVSYADLNLGSIAGQATLRQRIGRAATQVCGHSGPALRERAAHDSCRSAAIKDAMSVLASRRGGVVLASR